MHKWSQILAWPLPTRQRRLAEARARLSRQEFIDAAASTDVGRQAADILWYKLAEWIFWDGFTSYPEDSLLRIFGLAEEEVDEDMILDILETVGATIPTKAAVKAFGPVETLGDIVKFVEMAAAISSDGS